MPMIVWIYLTVLLYYSRVTSCRAMAEAYGKVSHDSLTRMLTGDWDGQKLLNQTVPALFTTISGGYLILDDTVIEKPYSEKLSEAAWVYSSRQKKTVFGISVVLLIWTNGRVRVPLAYRIWKKGGLSKSDMATEMLSYARNFLKLKPEFVLFDSWYGSERILRRIRDYGWYFICQLKKNRKFNSTALKKYRHQPYWTDSGCLTGGIKVCVAKYRRKYFATNRLSMDPKQIRMIYKFRWQIEEVFKLLKSHLSVENCQSGYQRKGLPRCQTAQEHHFVLCLIAFPIIERESIVKNTTWQKLRLNLTLNRQSLAIASLSKIIMIA